MTTIQTLPSLGNVDSLRRVTANGAYVGCVMYDGRLWHAYPIGATRATGASRDMHAAAAIVAGLQVAA